jgi:hypothetical protein
VSVAGFKASAAISTLSYDFTGIEVADDEAQALLDQAKGTTPEPSGRQVRHFQARQRELLGLTPDASPEDVTKRMAEMTEDDFLGIDDDAVDMVSEVTSGRPSREELAALPFRVREAYYGWIIGELNSPTTGSGTSSRRSLAPVKNA